MPIELLRSIHKRSRRSGTASKPRRHMLFPEALSAQKEASQHSAIPEDKVTLSAAAQAKQTASSIGAVHHQGVK
jgi:hypothetical protein